MFDIYILSYGVKDDPMTYEVSIVSSEYIPFYFSRINDVGVHVLIVTNRLADLVRWLREQVDETLDVDILKHYYDLAKKLRTEECPDSEALVDLISSRIPGIYHSIYATPYGFVYRKFELYSLSDMDSISGRVLMFREVDIDSLVSAIIDDYYKMVSTYDGFVCYSLAFTYKAMLDAIKRVGDEFEIINDKIDIIDGDLQKGFGLYS